MFATPVKFLNTLIPSWRICIIGVSTDGDRSMTGKIRGLSTQLRVKHLPGSFESSVAFIK